MKKDPFKPKIETPLKVSRDLKKRLDFDETSVDPRFGRDVVEDEKQGFPYRMLTWGSILILGIFSARLIYLQILHHHDYLSAAEGNRLRVQYLLAPRGLIYDRFQKSLVRNEPSFELILTPSDLPRKQLARSQSLTAAAGLFELNKQTIEEKLAPVPQASFFPITLKQNVPKDKAIVLLTQPETYPGFSIQNNPRRVYEEGPTFAHVVGYPGKLSQGEYEELKNSGYLYNDSLGKDGLESSYEEFLRGKLGERLVEVDAQGVVKNTFREKPPRPGQNLHLHLDSELQKVLFAALSKNTKAHRAHKAAAVALDPNTGGVLALVSLPSYDNNWFASGITAEQYQEIITNRYLPLFNRASSGVYPPGSTIKPFLAAAALQEGTITDTTNVYDGGKLVVPHRFDPNRSQTFRGWKPEGLGNMNVYSAIAWSSDIFFYSIGGGRLDVKFEGLGPERIAAYLEKFYFGQVTGIDLPSEKAGLVPTPEWKAQQFSGNPIEEQWYLGDTYNFSIGQGFLLTTPLQLAAAAAAVANGGTVWKPRLVEKITDRENNTVKEFLPEKLGENFIQPQILAMVKKGMRQTVTAGTAAQLSSLSIPVAGKTGTSQFEGADLSRTHAWFTAFAPYDDPRIVLAVLIEAGGEGSGAAVPVAAEVLDWYSKHRLAP